MLACARQHAQEMMPVISAPHAPSRRFLQSFHAGDAGVLAQENQYDHIAISNGHNGDDMSSSDNKAVTVPAGKFKAQCLALMDRVNRTGEEIIVTKHKRAVVKVVPVEPAAQPRPLFGRSKAVMTIAGDLVAPIGPDWDVGEDY
jgi:prevent-host-death family protein